MVDYQRGLEKMREYGIAPPVRRFSFTIADAKMEMERAMAAIGAELGKKLEWLPEYDEVAAWLSDNRGKGLLLHGSIGRGKSLMLKYILPLIFITHLNRIITVADCGDNSLNIDEFLRKNIIGLDDVGVEPDRKMKVGTERNVVIEAFNAAEFNDKMFIVASTNLTFEELKKRYGDRIVDRIRHLCHRVVFNGQSLRK
jgi:DNA replication protein DnaC